MNAIVCSMPIDKLSPHPDHPNHTSKANLAKLMRNIERTGLYEPLIVRPDPNQAGCYQIIHGHHRCEALRRLGQETASVLVWDIDDRETDILLVTLNRLVGRDKLDRKLTVLRRLGEQASAQNLARLLPYTSTQFQRLTALVPLRAPRKAKADMGMIPLVFFVSPDQQQTIEEALSRIETAKPTGRAAQRAAALTQIAQRFIFRRQRTDLPKTRSAKTRNSASVS
jgi:hypothetical protein